MDTAREEASMAPAAHDPQHTEEVQQLRSRIAQLEQEVARLHGNTSSPRGASRARHVSPPALRELLSRFPCSDAFYQHILDSLSDAFYIVDMEGQILFCNAALGRLSGYPTDELLGRPCLALYAPESAPAFLERRQRVARGEAVLPRLEAPLCRKEGDQLPVELFVTSLLLDGQVAGRVTVARDVRERKQLEAQLHHTQKLEAVSLLAGGFAHHFNNILQGILGFTELMMQEVLPESSMGDHLQYVRTAALRASDLVRQLLAFSRQTPALGYPVPFSVLLRDALTALRAVLPATIALRQHIPDEPNFVLGDATALHQVIVQLCTNAAEAMQHTAGLLDVRLDSIEVNAAGGPLFPVLTPGLYVRCTVCDTGPRIPHDHLDHIFEPFFTTKAPGEGTGMGLAIVHGIVISHGGHITVSSHVGEGATFEVYLPRMAPLEPFGIRCFYTDGWSAYERHITPEQHEVGKQHTHKVESKHINLRTRIKRLVRRPMCFSKTTTMHDLVIGLFINRYEFGLLI